MVPARQANSHCASVGRSNSSPELARNFPKALVARIGLGSLRAYVTATNVFTLTEVLSYSPEVMASSYPETKQYVFGINLTF